ncbi:hypothetical protein NDI86_21670 [Halomicroarcula sp. S3CR25-11]|uniref:Uncharacterized protein n=2 Tax=Haloarcula onubensis TaxID=2950539 RepID=A0ABU2FVB1_9EURY|nr:hypothetical protein [Halomicroarcula sp. S3CR25-11]
MAVATGAAGLDREHRKLILERVREQATRTVTDGGDRDGPNVDGDLLDDLEELLLDHVGSDNKITSGEVADELDIDDSEANPKTREAIRILLEERQFPVIGSSHGYHVPESREQVDEQVESLQSRAASIQERSQLIKEAWEQRGPAPGAGES